MRNVECRMRNGKKGLRNFEFHIPNLARSIGPPHPAEAGRSLQEEGLPGRYFLSTRPSHPGHNPSIPEMSNLVGPPAEPGLYPHEMILA